MLLATSLQLSGIVQWFYGIVVHEVYVPAVMSRPTFLKLFVYNIYRECFISALHLPFLICEKMGTESAYS